ncbi:MAG: DUF4292 domain-containing protein, partial [Chitinophagaceae bacterium]
MKHVKASLAIVVTMMSSAAVIAQSADEIIAKHFEALGGKEKISSIKSIYQEGSVNVMG